MSALRKNHITDSREEAKEAFDHVDSRVVLSDHDRDIFLALMESDKEPNDALKKAFARYKRQKV